MGLSRCSTKSDRDHCGPRFETMQSLVFKKRNSCLHEEVHEIGQDFDKDGNPVRLVRCQRCGLLIRECLPWLSSDPVCSRTFVPPAFYGVSNHTKM